MIALHGFLGRPADWDVLRPLLPGVHLQAIDLWRWFEQGGARDWERAGRALGECLTGDGDQGGGAGAEDVAAGVPGASRDVASAKVLLAYSFGARLALASVAGGGGGSAFDGVCLVSCNPGLAEEDREGRAARRDSDEAWARLLLEAPEEEIWRKWDAQPVLAAGSPAHVNRRVSATLPAERQTLAHALRAFSLAGQPDFTPRLRRWTTPLLWVTGSADAKFTSMAETLAGESVPASFAVCPGAGHRVPWDAPEAFSAIFLSWLQQLGVEHVDDHQDL